MPVSRVETKLKFDPNLSKNDFNIEQHIKNQQWSILGKALEIYLLWFLTLMILYALVFAGLLYLKGQKAPNVANSAQETESAQTSGNTITNLNNKDLYPVLNVAGDQSSFYLKYLDVDRISKSKQADPQNSEQKEEQDKDDSK
ncbi:ZYBA0S03-10880g1_1 [Zygosaccharomyces bailii CLIB 213]|uniref:ZYBA0S03-10880g1_1 n=1 Tax=Zygosaccharomyces bailii (strain CLIB 213 / ATCC 58445 / CBS 680 / BCRC 21525 / NBRC 1098 / NCYC 1416 / NRRL Y-2227) TaxID=1333698 RepID=A0A8J2T668_ZYGB2|nr:ZYBA0S03-10880g1_1 [Zygosaccharomyces bailii CLIB 213]